MEFRWYKGYRVVVSASDMLERLRQEKVDVLHCHGLASMAILSLTAARALKIPHLITFHTMANEAVKYYSPLPIRQDMIEPMVWLYLRNMLKRSEVVSALAADQGRAPGQRREDAGVRGHPDGRSSARSNARLFSFAGIPRACLLDEASRVGHAGLITGVTVLFHGVAALLDGDGGGDQGDHEQQGHAPDQETEAMVDSELVPSPVLGRSLLRLGQRATGVEERALGDAEAGDDRSARQAH